MASTIDWVTETKAMICDCFTDLLTAVGHLHFNWVHLNELLFSQMADQKQWTFIVIATLAYYQLLW